jgi:hypothetical protein
MGWLNVTIGVGGPSFPHDSNRILPFSTYYLTNSTASSNTPTPTPTTAATMSILKVGNCTDAKEAIAVAVEKYRGTTLWGNRLNPFSEIECQSDTDGGDSGSSKAASTSTLHIQAFDISDCHVAAAILNSMMDDYAKSVFGGCSTTTTTGTVTITTVTATSTSETQTETSTTKTSTTFHCKEFACTSGNACTYFKWMCDGEADCEDGSDAPLLVFLLGHRHYVQTDADTLPPTRSLTV